MERPEVRALARHADVLSAGAIEDYAGCPVHWLVERELAPASSSPTPTPCAAAASSTPCSSARSASSGTAPAAPA